MPLYLPSTSATVTKTKTSALVALTGQAVALNDLLILDDVSDTTQGAGGSLKSVTAQEHLASARVRLSNQSVSSQTGFAADTLLAGSNILIPTGFPIIGSTYRMVFDVTKTGAGTAAITMTIRMGTSGTGAVTDTSVLALAFGAGTGVADTGIIEVFATFRSVGASTNAVLAGQAQLNARLASTGLASLVKNAIGNSAGFDSTGRVVISVSYNGGASAAHTMQLVRSELLL